MNHTLAATIFSFFTAIVVLFQFALILGAPWGKVAMGGKYPGKFPPRMRIAAVIQIALLIFTALIVLTRAKLLLSSFYAFSETAIWGVVIFSAIGTVLNTITPSKWERIIWVPVTIILLFCSIYVAQS